MPRSIAIAGTAREGRGPKQAAVEETELVVPELDFNLPTYEQCAPARSF